MSLFHHAVTIMWGLCPSAEVTLECGAFDEPLTMPPVSAVSCDRRSCLASIDTGYEQHSPFQTGEDTALRAVKYAQVSGMAMLAEASVKPEFEFVPNSDFAKSVQAAPAVNNGPVITAQSHQQSDEIVINDEINSTPHVPVLKPADDPIGQYLKDQNTAAKSEEKSKKANTISFEIGLPLLLDDRYLGDAIVRVVGEIVYVDGKSILKLLKSDLTQQALRDLEALIGEDFLVIDEIEVEGLDIIYDPALQQIEVKTPLNSREIQVLHLGSEPLARTALITEPGKFSFFATPVISTLYNWDDINGAGKGFQPLRGSLNVGGRLFGEKGVSFFSRQGYTGGVNGGFRRDESVLYYDRLDKLVRASVGDLRPRGLGFQSTPSISGLSFERFFDLEPNRLFRPTGDSSFELERPSTVDIRLNGVTRSEVILQPGRYNIDDLPLVQGSNLVDLVIRDDLGRERIISDQSFFDFGLLEPGIPDFSLSAGVKTTTSNSGVVYTDDYAATGFFRYGLNNSLTVGVDAQGDKTGGNAGLSALFASALGVFRFEASGSQYSDTGSGFAGEVGYRFLGGGSLGGWSFSFTGNAQYFSENFSTLSNASTISVDLGQLGQNLILDTTFDNSPTRPFSILANGNARIRKGRVTLSASAAHNIGRGINQDTTNFLGGVNYQVNNRLSVGAFGRHTRFDGLSETSANLQLNYRLGRGRNLRANYDTSFNEIDVQYNKAAANGVGSLSYNIAGISNLDNDTHGVNANAFYTGNRFESSFDHSLVNDGGGIGPDFQQFSQAGLTTSFVFVDGAFGFGRPVQSSFAILEPHETLKGRKVLINPTENGYITSSDFLGAAVASEGQAFTTRSTYFDVEDLPIGYDLGEGQYTTRAPLFAGYKVAVGSGASFTILGYLKDKLTGKPLPNFGGRLVSLDNPSLDPIPAFTNRNARLAASGLKPGRYKLTIFNDPSFEKIITIPKVGEPLIQLGDIEVNAK